MSNLSPKNDHNKSKRRLLSPSYSNNELLMKPLEIKRCESPRKQITFVKFSPLTKTSIVKQNLHNPDYKQDYKPKLTKATILLNQFKQEFKESHKKHDEFADEFEGLFNLQKKYLIFLYFKFDGQTGSIA